MLILPRRIGIKEVHGDEVRVRAVERDELDVTYAAKYRIHPAGE